MGDATIIDVRDCILFYSYEVRGVAYTTSQDASELKNLLPAETSTLVGPTALKYSSNNPANSIVICEEWSGLRLPPPRSSAGTAASADVNAVRHSAQDSALAESAER